MSRPRKENKRSEIIRFKMTKEEKERLKQEAKKRDLTVSQFIRISILSEIDSADLDYEGGYLYD